MKYLHITWIIYTYSTFKYFVVLACTTVVYDFINNVMYPLNTNETVY